MGAGVYRASGPTFLSVAIVKGPLTVVSAVGHALPTQLLGEAPPAPDAPPAGLPPSDICPAWPPAWVCPPTPAPPSAAPPLPTARPPLSAIAFEVPPCGAAPPTDMPPAIPVFFLMIRRPP